MYSTAFVPIVLGSNKTTVSVGTGNNEYWPIYLSIGNIHNNIRRAHQNGIVVLGFLGVMIHPNFSHPCRTPSSSPYPRLSNHYH